MENCQTFFFLVSGFGLGNTSRQIAIIEEILTRNPDSKITVFSSGEALKFFKLIDSENIEIVALTEKKGYLSNYVLSFLFSFFRYLLTYFKNCDVIKEKVVDKQAITVVCDSSYYFLPFLFKSNIKLISLNQCPNVFRNIWKLHLFLNIRLWPSIFTETLDYFINILFFDEIYVPVFNLKEFKSCFKKIVPIRLIIQKKFLNYHFSKRRKKEFILLTSGSGIGSEKVRKKYSELNNLSSEEKQDFDTQPTPPDIYEFKGIVIQGGLSSASEALFGFEEIEVVPIDGHVEQTYNTIQVNKLLGVKSHFRNKEQFLGEKDFVDRVLTRIRNS